MCNICIDYVTHGFSVMMTLCILGKVFSVFRNTEVTLSHYLVPEANTVQGTRLIHRNPPQRFSTVAVLVLLNSAHPSPTSKRDANARALVM